MGSGGKERPNFWRIFALKEQVLQGFIAGGEEEICRMDLSTPKYFIIY